MIVFERRALSAPTVSVERRAAGLAALAGSGSVALLLHRDAPGAPTLACLGLVALTGLCAGALLFALDGEPRRRGLIGVAAGAALAVIGALLGSDARLGLASFASVAFGAGLAVWLVRAARGRMRVPPNLVALYAALLTLFCAYAVFLVLVSRDLMIADFMTYRGISVMVARLIDAGMWPLLTAAAAESITQDYGWGPALLPGLALALTEPTSRAVYTFALLALYAAPAVVALAILARGLARRAGARLGEGGLALSAAAIVFAYPAGIAIAARGMPDVGGLVLLVCALTLADRLARLLALGRRRDARIAPMTRRVALALALTLFAMFAFRRWYAFAGAGIAAMLAIEVARMVLRAPRRFPWKNATAAAALGVLTMLALASPVIIDWLPNLSAHDYANAYAAYRKPPAEFARELGDWIGLLPALAAFGAAAWLWARSSDRRLLRLTLGSAAIAALLFLRIQTPYIHHLYLVAPAIVAPVAAALLLLFAGRPGTALAGLAALGGVTLTPLAATLNPSGLAPIAALPRPPRADLAELARLKDWVDERARPDFKVCGLGSSYTFSGELIDELWQLRPEREVWPRPKVSVRMPDVDAVDGPPAAGLKDCAILIVGEPVQTHLDPGGQQTVVMPSREVLAGQGVGAKFRRTGEVFHLEKGVSAVVFERMASLDDSDVAALQARWRAARAAQGDASARP